MNHAALQKDKVALITGGASGIGYAVAELLAESGMRVCLADQDAAALDAAASNLNSSRPNCAITRVTNVADLEDMTHLKTFVAEQCGTISFLMNNAGVGGGGGAFSNLSGWEKVLGVNLWGVIHGLQLFVPDMIAAGQPGVVVNTGSKQGITNPPGDAAYNVSKAGVRAMTEHLAHELRNIKNCQISAHLLVPGFTYTGMIRRFIDSKPAAAWDPEQVAQKLIAGIEAGDFYTICPDNDVSEELDCARFQWNTDDLVNNRPALSRWHPEHAPAFEAFVADYLSKNS